MTAAGFAAQTGDIDRFTSADKVAKYAGISPVTFLLVRVTRGSRIDKETGFSIIFSMHLLLEM